MRYRDRADAGQQLAELLQKYSDRDDVILLGLPRGGVPVAAEIASALHLPLDIMLVRKLGVPGQEELAMGAIALGGVEVHNDMIIQQIGIPKSAIDRVAAHERLELNRRNLLYRAGRPAPDLAGKTVILVDDGLATGATMQAAVGACRKAGARAVVAAVPVGASDSCYVLSRLVDEMVCPFTPSPFYGVGRWYMDFSQTSDDEVTGILAHPGRVAEEQHP